MLRPGYRLSFAVAQSFRQSRRALASAATRLQDQPDAGKGDTPTSTVSVPNKLDGRTQSLSSHDDGRERQQAKLEDGCSNVDVTLRPAINATSSSCRNRGVVLTGGTGGIGLAVAKRLVQEGAGRVVVVSRDSDRGHEAIQKIKEQTQLKDAPLSVCVAHPPHYADQVQTLLRGFPWCNTLINCAGMTQSQLILKTTTAQCEEIINTNLATPINLSKYFLQHHLSQHKHRNAVSQTHRPPGFTENAAQSYSLVNVSSLLAYKATLGTATYAATKAGLIAHTRALALEASLHYNNNNSHSHSRTPFRANVVVPGYIDTPMTTGTGSNISETTREKLSTQIPLRRFGVPDEVADAIVFLITNEYANNCVLNIDGGLSAT